MILVYKTNITTKSRALAADSELKRLLPDVKWNFDLEDCDKILRIDSREDITRLLQNEMVKFGISIEELPD